MNGTLPVAARAQPMGFSYRVGWLFFRALFGTCFRWRYFNPERVPALGPVILASNHASYLDPPLVGAPIHRPINFLARDTLFRFPGMGALLRSWHTIPVDREGGGAAGVRKILEALQAGRAVVVFPEGTRTRDGQLQHARSGIGLIVLKSDAPVVPVRVFGTYEAYGRRARVPKPCRIGVKYGKLIPFESIRAEAKSCGKARLKELYQEIANQIMVAIGELEPFADTEQFP